MFGPDSKASLTVDEFGQLVEGVRFLEQARKDGPDKVLDGDKQALRLMFGKALAVNRDLPSGYVLQFDDLEGKKPANGGLLVSSLNKVLGRRLVRSKQRWDFIGINDLE